MTTLQPLSGTTIERLDRQSLQDRYGIKHGAFYDRLNLLKIELVRDGKKSFATAEQIKLLDDYHAALKRNEGKAFLRDRGLLADIPAEMSFEAKIAPTHNLQDLAIAFTQAIAQLKPEPLPAPEPDLFAHLRKLEEVATHGWVLPSAMVRDLIGAWPPGGDRFERWGFVFVRTSKKQPWWRISKG